MIRFYIAILIVSIVFFLVDFYAFQALKTITKNKYAHWIWGALALIVYAQFFFTIYTRSPKDGQTPEFQYSSGLLLLFLIPKIILIFVLFGEDIYRIIVKLFRVISSSETKSMPDRRKFISQLALGLAAIPFASFIYGFVKGKYNFKVLKYELAFDD